MVHGVPLQTSSTKIFTGLTKNKSYKIEVRAIANSGKIVEKAITVKTSDIQIPTYDVKK